LTKYQRYQDYVIKDGKLVGEFEAMYQDFDNPWDQSFREDSVLSKSVVENILRQGGFKRPYEIGCGLGYFVEKMRTICGAGGGIDVSSTAIEKARAKFPKCHFDDGDILEVDKILKFQPDCVFMDEVTWYVLDKLDEFKSLLSENFKGISFLHTLRQYPEGTQRYGKEYFTNLKGFMDYFESVVDFSDWGSFGSKVDPCMHTFFVGVIK
jgi:SAM-dependent methyltransferase